MNQESGKGIIFGVLGILTLIIAIMGIKNGTRKFQYRNFYS